MKRAALLISFLMFLAGGTVMAGPGGVWKNVDGTVGYSWYIQTYAQGSMLVMMTADAGSFYIFMDPEYTGYFSADNDLACNGHSLAILFSGDDTAYAVLSLAGAEKSEILELVRNSVAPALVEDPGSEDPGSEDPGGEDPGGEDPGVEDPGGEDPGSGSNGNPPTGSLLTPPDGSVVIGLTNVSGRCYDDIGLERVIISIGGGPGVEATLNTGNGPFMGEGVFSYYWDSTTASKGPITLTATAYDTEGLSSFIGSVTVTVNNTVGPVANQVQPISPALGASNLSPPIAMTWNPVDKVVGYRIQVADNVSFTSPLLVDQDVSGTSYTFNQSVSGTLYWRVRGNISSIEFAPWSYTWSFSISGAGQ